jgi:hypothetical protein
MESQVIEYSKTEQALVELRNKYQAVVWDVKSSKGMTAAKEARSAIRGYRTDLEKKRVEIKAPALERCRLIDAEAKRIEAELRSLEEPIDEQIKAEEKRKEEEKLDLLRKENQRITAIEAKIAAIRDMPSRYVNSSSDDAYLAQQLLVTLKPDESFQEFLPEAIKAHEQSMVAISAIISQRMQHEEEQARIAAEREELAKLRAEQQAREAEEQQKRATENARIDAERRAEEVNIMAARDAEEARIAGIRKAEQAERDAEERRLTDERFKIALEREALETAKRVQDSLERHAKDVEARKNHVSAISDEMISIKRSEYDELLEDSAFLNALRAAGVDNWDGYDYALEILEEQEVA